jgi:voltage-gated potassium channel Kch
MNFLPSVVLFILLQLACLLLAIFLPPTFAVLVSSAALITTAILMFLMFVSIVQNGAGRRGLLDVMLTALAGIAAIAVYFAVLHLHAGLVMDEASVTSLPVAIYFSVVAWTTLGFGDVLPATDTGRWLVVVEALFGYVIMALLISVFLAVLKKDPGQS